MKKDRMDLQLLVSVLLLTTAGLLIFLSASLGLLARDSVYFSSIIFKQICFGLIPGLLLLYGASKVNYMHWRRASFWIFVLAIILNLAIFVPGLGLKLNGATRWLSIGSFSLQVSEILKIGAIVYFAAWLSGVREKVSTFAWGFGPLLGMLAITGGLLLIQPDTDTFIVIAVALVSMYLVAGGKWRYIAILAVIGALGLALLAYERPYVRARITTFLDPAAHAETSGYQIQQSFIAIGSGGLFGRGFGQSIQKFNYLPEQVSDSIFAVAAEEFGLVGSLVLLGMFVFFSLRCLRLAPRANHPFGGLLFTGIAAFLISQSFLNIGSMVGVVPLSGMPLPFVSQGGTALLFALAEAGVLLNISRFSRMRR